MTGTWLTLNEIAALLSRTKRRIIQRAQDEHWPYRSYAVRGGQERRYHLAGLPEKIRAAYAVSLKVSLTELQSQLKPVLTREKKASIARYNGRGAKAGNVNPKERIPEKYLETANARLGVPQTYGASGLSAGKAGVIAREFRERPGPRGGITSFQSLYRWLGRYEQYGIEGLAPRYGGGAGPGHR
jgi:hypothetical protein